MIIMLGARGESLGRGNWFSAFYPQSFSHYKSYKSPPFFQFPDNAELSESKPTVNNENILIVFVEHVLQDVFSVV